MKSMEDSNNNKNKAADNKLYEEIHILMEL